VLRSIENKKLLSTAGKLKLLSGADKAGFNLAKVPCRISSVLAPAHEHHRAYKYPVIIEEVAPMLSRFEKGSATLTSV
jgi:hypothetical protein